jgi:hypothetical protein
MSVGQMDRLDGRACASSCNLGADPEVSQAQQLMEVEMKTLSAIAVSLVLATGAALAQGTGGAGSGGTDTGPGGTNTGKDAAAMNPTVEQCQKGWDSSMRLTQAEFKAACEKK